MIMDLSETYRSIAKIYFPNATIVTDRFHVVRLNTQHFPTKQLNLLNWASL